MSWYVRKTQDGKALGPFPDDRIHWNVEQGNLRADMWYSRDGEHWRQHPLALFPREEDEGAPEEVLSPHEVERASRSNAPWLMGAVTTVLLLFALGLNQWATTSLTVTIGRDVHTSALHYGARSMATAVDARGNERAIKVDERTYAQLLSSFPVVERAKVEATAGYGKLFLWVILLACAARLLGSYLVWKAPRFAGSPAWIYGGATVLVAAVFIVALLFNNSGLVQEFRPGGTAEPGFGFSTWVVLLALVLDAFGILAVMVACTPHPTRVRRHRRIRTPARRRRA